MGPKSHQKISTICVILILMCTFGLQAVVAAQTTNSDIATELIEEVDGERINSDLEKAETKDPQKLEIIKQIRKLNNDGSYTVGYEADDGTFKIESRDVLGNVKGTYGYIDVNGEIKRVSYTANNDTGIKSSAQVVDDDDNVQISRYNRSVGTPTTRRPVYSSANASPTRSTVIQTIPRRLRVLTSSSSSSSSTTERPFARDYTSSSIKSQNQKSEPTTTIVYATSVPTPKPYVNIRPTPLPGTLNKPAEQMVRPEKLEIDHVSKVQISAHKDASTSKPVVEEIDENDEEEETKIGGGNVIRRQLMQGSENQYDTRQQIVYSQSASDESSHVYGSVSSTARPLFTTTSGPRIPALVLAARNRANQIQNNLNSQSTTEKYYIKSPRRQDSQENEPTTEPTSERTYLTQNPIQVQIPANRQVVQINDEEKRTVRRPSSFRSPQFIQRSNNVDQPRLVRIPIPQNAPQVQETEQYIRETTTPSTKNEQIAEQEQIPVGYPQGYYTNPTQPPPGYYGYSQQEPFPGYPQQPYPIQYQQPNQYRGFSPNSNYYDQPERPLTARDFERLLQLLVYRHQQLQRLSYSNVNPYYPQYPPLSGYPQYVRPSIYPNPYDGRISYRPITPYPEQENMYQAQSPISSTESSMPYELQRLIPRKRPYNPRYFPTQNGAYSMDSYEATSPPQQQQQINSPGYLPPDIREELLYRMLMLALQNDPSSGVGASASTGSSSYQDPDSSSSTAKSPIIYKKPVRSVQILGEE